MASTNEPSRPADTGKVGELLHRITDDVKSIAGDELELARAELSRRLKAIAIDAAAMILGGVVVLIGLGFVCVAAVDALAPVIPALWLRLLLLAAVYTLGAGALVYAAEKRLMRRLPPDLPSTRAEAVRTVEAVKEELRHA